MVAIPLAGNLLPIAVGMCLTASSTFAQSSKTDFSAVDRACQRSIPGGQIAAVTVDLYMNPSEEQRIMQRLGEPWGKQIRCITLQHLQHYLNEVIPTTIDVPGLDDLGLTPDIPINSEIQASELRGVTLTRCLPNLDLTWALISNRIWITTPDAAESNLVVRIYDVTPLTQYETRNVPHPSHFDFDSLVELVVTSIVPDTWEILGGPSTTGTFFKNGRGLMVVSTTTPVHLQIESMLNHLNRLAHVGNAGCENFVGSRKPIFREGKIGRSNRRLPKFGYDR